VSRVTGTGLDWPDCWFCAADVDPPPPQPASSSANAIGAAAIHRFNILFFSHFKPCAGTAFQNFYVNPIG
jgi:hypothetical protein